MVKCTNCGNELNPGDSRCTNCGQKAKGKGPLSKGIKITIAVTAVFFIAVAVITIMLLTSKEFGDTYWGMSEEKVISIEKSKGNSNYEVLSREPGFARIVFHNVVINGETADVEYAFRSNNLYQGVYHFDKSDASKTQPFIQELTKKYGQPTEYSGPNNSGQYLWRGFRTMVSLQYTKGEKGFSIYYDSRQND